LDHPKVALLVTLEEAAGFEVLHEHEHVSMLEVEPLLDHRQRGFRLPLLGSPSVGSDLEDVVDVRVKFAALQSSCSVSVSVALA